MTNHIRALITVKFTSIPLPPDEESGMSLEELVRFYGAEGMLFDIIDLGIEPEVIKSEPVYGKPERC